LLTVPNEPAASKTTDILALLRTWDSPTDPDNIREEAAREIERLRAALVIIRDAPAWIGSNPEFGDGHDSARESAADIAKEALANAE
jgi:hypothetical protein